MWVMLLNDMRSANVETIEPVFRAETKEILFTLLSREMVEPYSDGQWGKCYRIGGPLEWFNPPWGFEEGRHFQNAGTREEWAAAAEHAYDMRVMTLPVCP